MPKTSEGETKANQPPQVPHQDEEYIEGQRIVNEKIEDLESRLRYFIQDYERLSEEKAYYQEWYERLHLSRSWKITSPLRKMGTATRNILHNITGKTLFTFDYSSVKHIRQQHEQIKKSLGILVADVEEIKKVYSKSFEEVKTLKYYLFELGFIEAAYNELLELTKNDNAAVKRRTTWELVLWHISQHSKSDAIKALELIKELKSNKKQSGDWLLKSSLATIVCHATLENKKEGREVVNKTIEAMGPRADLYLAAANFEDRPINKIACINKALSLYDIPPIDYSEKPNKKPYDCLSDGLTTRRIDRSQPKVTVIVPVFNAEGVINTALNSILSQTWTNLEVLVVDDCSTDNTPKIIKEYTKIDGRVKFLQTPKNSGPYIARNIALKEASGEFVTCNDADDWSHPNKIRVQVKHLIQNQFIVANTSQLARTTDELEFKQFIGKGSFINEINASSLMFRRQRVIDKVGFWDAVRFGADSEFIRRIEKAFGRDALAKLRSGPLSLARESSQSLTGSNAFGINNGHLFGVRREYKESLKYFHNTSRDLYYDFPMSKRPFPAPIPMIDKESGSKRRSFDVVIASDLRLDDISHHIARDIMRWKEFGLRIGLVNINRFDLNIRKDVASDIRKLIDGGQIQMLSYGEKAATNTLIIRHPPILQEQQKYIPDIKPSNIHLIVDQTPVPSHNKNGDSLYDFPNIQKRLVEYFGDDALSKTAWYPSESLIREQLLKHHSSEMKGLHLSDNNWPTNISRMFWDRLSTPGRVIPK